MKLTRALTALAALSMVACSGLSVTQDFSPGTDFSRLQSWDFMPASERAGGDPRGDNDIVEQRIRGAIETQMAAKGFQQVNSGDVDFRVGYYLILDDRVDYHTVNTYYGGGWGYGRMYGGRYGGGYGGSQTTAVEYTQGSLIVDFFDLESKELVWRGSAEGKVHETADPMQKQERVNLAIQKILAQFPGKG
jgi:hypothetical protein